MQKTKTELKIELIEKVMSWICFVAGLIAIPIQIVMMIKGEAAFMYLTYFTFAMPGFLMAVNNIVKNRKCRAT